MTYKKHFCIIISLTLLILVLCAIANVVIDPFFHYHKPLDKTSYFLHNQRYQNDGILKQFDYNAVITGSSMTENFKASECDSIYGVKSVKLPYYGGSFCEIDRLLSTAFKANKNITTVIRGLDINKLADDKDLIGYNNLPQYLYDDNLINDVKYVLNKDVLFGNTAIIVKNMLLNEQHPIDFDEYSNWSQIYGFSKEAVLAQYNRIDYKVEKQIELSNESKQTIKENIQQNVINIAKQNPQATFYYFYTPFSIVYYDSILRDGTLNSAFDELKYATELILQQENIKLFSYIDEYEMACDLNNFKDSVHYHEDINSNILRWMKNGKGELTKENYVAHFDEALKFYTEYNYDLIFE